MRSLLQVLLMVGISLGLVLILLIKQRLVLHRWSFFFFKQWDLSISNTGNKIFEVCQFMEKLECLNTTMITGNSVLKYWAGVFLQIRLEIRTKINWFSLVSVTVKPLSSERLPYALRNLEIKEGLQNNKVLIAPQTPADRNGSWWGEQEGQNQQRVCSRMEKIFKTTDLGMSVRVWCGYFGINREFKDICWQKES